MDGKTRKKKWSKWVKNMHSKYQYLWKKSGIYEAIMTSTYQIRRNPEVVFAVAERWCAETSTFMFPWGEATITLEDMMILGGFSVLGTPVSMPLESRELVEIQERLKKLRKSISKSKKHQADHWDWLDYFVDSGSNLEHEAFLSLWLSRFVLPGNVYEAINDNNFSVAIYLAKGIRIALGPTVLASLYRDLSLLKGIIADSINFVGDDNGNFLALSLWSPIQFVQVWAWERLPSLQPKPKLIYPGQPRLARWHGVNRSKRENLRWVIDSAVDIFLWRPYTISVENWLFPKFYRENEEWLHTDCGDLSEVFESYARCLRVSELVGVDSIEHYLPHRVAMQFGIDQDLPGWIPKSKANPEIAWDNYNRPVSDDKLYFPSRLFEADVTSRYLEWWEKSVLDPQGEIKGPVKGKSSRRSTKSLRSSNDDFPSVPQKSNWGKEMFNIFNRVHIQNRMDEIGKPFLAVTKNCFPSTTEGNYDDVCCGSTRKGKLKEEMSQSCNKHGIKDRMDVNEVPILAAKRQCLASSTQSNDDYDVPPGFPPKCNSRREMSQTFNKYIQVRVDENEKAIFSAKRQCLPSSTQSSNADVPPGFPPKRVCGKEMLQACNKINDQGKLEVKTNSILDVKKESSAEDSDADVPPGFPPNYRCRKGMLQTCNKHHSYDDRLSDNVNGAFRKNCLSSSTEHKGAFGMKESSTKPIKVVSEGEAMIRSEKASEIADSHQTKSENSVENMAHVHYEEEGLNCVTKELPELDIITRIGKLEKFLARLQHEGFGCRSVKQEPDNST